MTHNRAEVRRLLDRAGATPRRSLGQNFLVDANTARRIARLAGVGEGDRVVEIGAGLGSLTLALAQTGADVLAIETDAKLAGVLAGVAAEASEADEAGSTAAAAGEAAGGAGSTAAGPVGRVTVLRADARRLDWAATLGSTGDAASSTGHAGWDLVANLPYNIATSLVLTVLDEVPQVRRLLVMCQREAAERLAADAGDGAYGRVSVLVRMHAGAEVVGAVPSTVFWPEPAVESALVRITRHDETPPPELAATLRALLRRGFGRRRQMLRRSLRADADGPEQVRAWLSDAGIDERARPEELGYELWLALAETVHRARCVPQG